MRLTQDEIYRLGLEALRERLGRAGMVRFLQQLETGKGDYARERRAWVDRVTLDDLKQQSSLGQKVEKKGKRKGKP